MADVRASHYTPTEEIVHATSHGVGAILGVVALVWMIQVSVVAEDPWRILASCMYGASLIILFGASTLYHGLHQSPLRNLFKLFDHCAIYLLIAGTSTPFLLVAMQTDIRWWLFGAMWLLAAAGVTAKIWLGHQYPRMSMASYLLMGWLMIFALPQLMDAIGPKGIAWLVAGGISYTAGAAFYMAKRMYFHHAIWHFFVLAGAACHFVPVICYVLPVRLPISVAS